jgi:hypothetical protein
MKLCRDDAVQAEAALHGRERFEFLHCRFERVAATITKTKRWEDVAPRERVTSQLTGILWYRP